MSDGFNAAAPDTRVAHSMFEKVLFFAGAVAGLAGVVVTMMAAV